MLIRTFQDADAPVVAALWGEVFAGERPHNDAPRIFAEKREVQPDLFFVAEADGAVVGTVVAGYDGHRGWLYRVAVEPRVQRSGIGTALVRHAEAALVALGCPKINLQVRTSNAAVIAFYKKLGWDVEELLSLGKIVPRRDNSASAKGNGPCGRQRQERMLDARPERTPIMSPPQTGIVDDQTAVRGEEIYHRVIRPTLTEADRGKAVAIDVDSGDYEIGKDGIVTIPALKSRRPDAKVWMRRVGYRTYRWFGSSPPTEPI